MLPVNAVPCVCTSSGRCAISSTFVPAAVLSAAAVLCGLRVAISFGLGGLAKKPRFNPAEALELRAVAPCPAADCALACADADVLLPSAGDGFAIAATASEVTGDPADELLAAVSVTVSVSNSLSIIAEAMALLASASVGLPACIHFLSRGDNSY